MLSAPSVAGITFQPLIWLIAASFSLFFFNTFRVSIATFATSAFAKQGAWQPYVNQVAKPLNQAAEAVLGKASPTLKLKMSDILLMAVVLVLMQVLHVLGKQVEETRKLRLAQDKPNNKPHTD